MRVYISEYLKNTIRGKLITNTLKEILGKKLSEIPQNKNEWCRDYMPVKGYGGHLVLFKYSPSYIVGRTTLEKTIPEQKQICNNLGLEYTESSVILDGGAIDIFEDIGIVSDRVIFDNCSSWMNQEPSVLKDIKERLKLNKLVVVPSDPWDFTGHVDGMVRFINNNKVLINDSSTIDNAIKLCTKKEQEKYEMWKNNLHLSLKNAGLEIEVLPCAVSSNEDDSDTDATGIYLNFLLLEDKIIMPSFEQYPDYNKAAKKKLKNLYNREVLPVEAGLLAQHGGIINCVTWNF
ncbi:agmatine deiminase family protein [Maribellus sp. YY47]|uniref:agmatine deiminase family protein n=1 Tax=Maribellus sp. YY47 TaxID=2929486 RepID=UPI002000F0A2|nr:agmatine deiminase family protein [Maribellus sp. YY47]MCK3683987.1 agmatine deiminase family protein [Maribellus sp. YY47]